MDSHTSTNSKTINLLSQLCVSCISWSLIDLTCVGIVFPSQFFHSPSITQASRYLPVSLCICLSMSSNLLLKLKTRDCITSQCTFSNILFMTASLQMQDLCFKKGQSTDIIFKRNICIHFARRPSLANVTKKIVSKIFTYFTFGH